MSSVTSDFFIHESAIIEEGVSIGSGTRIWHHAHVRAGAKIGRNCVLGKNVFVDEHVVVGNSVKIQNNVSVYKGVHLEDEVLVGPSVVFTNDRFPRALTSDWQLVETHVRKGASIGANATIVCGIEIGPWGLVGAGAVVTRTVESHEAVVGNPARRIGWACRCGHLVAHMDQRLTEAVVCQSCGEVLTP